MTDYITLIIFSVTNIFCVWLGAKVSRQEPLYSKPANEPIAETKDLMPSDEGFDLNA